MNRPVLVSEDARLEAKKLVVRQRAMDEKVAVLLKELGISQVVSEFCRDTYREIRGTCDKIKLDELSNEIMMVSAMVRSIVKDSIVISDDDQELRLEGNELSRIRTFP